MLMPDFKAAQVDGNRKDEFAVAAAKSFAFAGK
jgi:hypothetical protein